MQFESVFQLLVDQPQSAADSSQQQQRLEQYHTLTTPHQLQSQTLTLEEQEPSFGNKQQLQRGNNLCKYSCN